MDSFAYPIFQLISTLILSGYSAVVDPAIAKFGTSIMIIALGIETMYIAHYGYIIILQKSTEAVPNPSLRDLLYHVIIVIIVLHYVKTDVDSALGLVKALRRMIIDGLTGAMQTSPGEWSTGNLINPNSSGDLTLLGLPPISVLTTTIPGRKIAIELGLMNAAFAASNLLTMAPVMKDVSAPLQTTAFIMALISDVSPQITAGIIFLINELMIKTGLALFPLALYCMLYKVTREFFHSWLNMMFAASIQMAVLIVTITICTKVTISFLAILATLSAGGIASHYMSSTVGSYVISELQESVIQAGFGITLTALIAWVPANSANFAGTLLTAGTTKSGVGMAMSTRNATPHQPYMRKTAQKVGRFINNVAAAGTPSATQNTTRPPNPSANTNTSGTRPNPSANSNVASDKKMALDKLARDSLGVSANATLAEIKRAYRKEALNHHPDKNSSVESSIRIREVNNAYEQLTKSDGLNTKSNSSNASAGANPSTSSARSNSDTLASSNTSNAIPSTIRIPTPRPSSSEEFTNTIKSINKTNEKFENKMYAWLTRDASDTTKLPTTPINSIVGPNNLANPNASVKPSQLPDEIDKIHAEMRARNNLI